ncbi:hypothetical protein HDU85_005389 [Gaertneriomyces sp. JEL0708]|nr:hypothetical protein HDU85_005389 [Gaertneriomyces sp. JEL0708]
MANSFYTLKATGDVSFPTAPGVGGHVMKHLLGFDPAQLLESVEFPNDKYDKIIRQRRSARKLAIRRIPIPVQSAGESGRLAEATPEDTPTPARRRQENGPANEDDMVRDQLARMAAAVTIQAAFRGWRTRQKYIAVICSQLTWRTHRLSPPDVGVYGGLPFQRELPDITLTALHVQERLIRRYHRYCDVVERLHEYNILPPTFPDFAAAYIQSVWRMWIVRRNWLKFQRIRSGESTEAEEARKAMLWKVRAASRQYGSSRHEAAIRIQRMWKSYYNLKIYRFYRDLIKYRLRGHPGKILRFINPQESRLMDPAMAIHVRFRLGGSSFPPTIFYKIFAHKSLIDMNAFSPRYYTAQQNKQPLPIDLFDQTGPLLKPADNGWYQRVDNNGWRPVSDKLWDPAEGEELTPPKPVKFHHLKLKRRQQLEQLKRARKIAWLQKMYRDGRHLDPNLKAGAVDPSLTNAGGLATFNGSDPTAEELLGVDTNMDENFLIQWSTVLDFEAYFENWIELAITGASDGITSPVARQPVVESVVDEVGATSFVGDSNVEYHSDQGDVRKSRPWSGKSDRSITDLLISQREGPDF